MHYACYDTIAFSSIWGNAIYYAADPFYFRSLFAAFFPKNNRYCNIKTSHQLNKRSLKLTHLKRHPESTAGAPIFGIDGIAENGDASNVEKEKNTDVLTS
jgi:hypothetical protein